MGFSDHKITNFTHRISDLPDQPSLSPQELKACFDSSPEQLRAAHNAVCDEGEALAARIDSYRAQTFTGEITRDMLAEEVQQEIGGKAEQSALEAEAAARETLAQTVAAKCEVYFGTYTGDGAASRQIPLSFTPQALLVFKDSGNPSDGYGGLAFPGHNVSTNGTSLEIVENGFMVYYKSTGGLPHTNAHNTNYYFIAFK